MARVRRLFVEKRAGFDGAAHHLCNDLRQMLNLPNLTGVRIVLRYDVQGLPDDAWGQARSDVFAEAAVDALWDEMLPEDDATAFAVEYLPGQYDQRADSAAQCVQLITRGEPPLVRCATVYLLYGDLTAGDVARVKGYLINPVDSREAALGKPENLELTLETPPDVPVVEGFTALEEAGVAALNREMAMAMSLADLRHVQRYFRDEEHRDPTVAELRVIDTYWSDHCRHTTFLTELTDIAIEGGETAGVSAEPIRQALREYEAGRQEVHGGRKPMCLMDLATLAAKRLKKRGLLPALDESEEINACSIEADVNVDGAPRRYLIQFKNETHNHPTEIEPFGGAATCLGGAIRDPLSGRAYVYQAMRVTGAGDPRQALGDTLPGKLPQRKITREAAHGYSSYGNQIGLATGQVTEIYHPGYVAKRMELGAVVGAVPKENVRRERPAPGDVVILLGGRTGRDGIGGATGSSKAHTEQSVETAGAEVQKGNPPTERKLQRLFRKPEVTRLIKRCNDFGAGGVCVAIGELADGLDIDLDLVPKKYEGLDGTELAISESQERMAVVVEARDSETFLKLAAAENLEATVVAKVTDNRRMRMAWRGKTIIDLARPFLDTNGAAQYAKAVIAAPNADAFFTRPEPSDRPAAVRAALSSLNECSQRGLVEMFDSTIGAGTVLMPFGGRRQMTPAQAMAALVPVEGGTTDTCTVMAHGFFPNLSVASPFHGAVYAVVESLGRVAAAGGDIEGCYLTFQEYFERLGTDPTRWGKPLAALLGAYWAQCALEKAAIGGKDSMSGSFGTRDVPPTLVSFALGTAKAPGVVSAELKRAGSRLVLLRLPRDGQNLPDFAAFRRNCAALKRAFAAGQALAAHTVGEGGAAAALAKMTFGNGIGLRIEPKAPVLEPALGSFVVELAADPAEVFAGLTWQEIGETADDGAFTIDGKALGLADLQAAWEAPLEPVFPTVTQERHGLVKTADYNQRGGAKPAVRIVRPRVLIPVFPGTNCEYDSARAFERAGATAQVLVIRNLTSAAIAESMAELASAIDRSQIVMLPGGFSAGDEPDGSGKFIAALFREGRVAEATARLLNQRDGLMLGICNGFQALIKLGLVPYGQIGPMGEASPTLTFNAIGRHQSRLFRTRVASVKSPWLAGLNCGDVITTAISHGEGRFTCAEAEYDRLLANGQVALQYVDEQGRPAMDTLHNPNGSLHAVEAITSPDGRVLGKMGHNERAGENVFRNVPGQYESRIFASGVQYFL